MTDEEIAEQVAHLARAQVKADIETHFTGILDPQEGRGLVFGLPDSTLEEALAFARSDQLIAVPWLFPCTHVGRFLDIPATHADLELHGTTIVDIREGAWLYHRFIDYIGALHQIGVPTDGRAVHAELADRD